MIETGVILPKPTLVEEKTARSIFFVFSKPHDATTRRARRVMVLLAGIFVLSIADLVATVAQLQAMGMVEINPLAAFIIRKTNSIWGLAALKMLSVGLCIVLLYRLRCHIQGEIAAWLGLLILTALIFYWGHYAYISNLPDALTIRHNGIVHDQWLTLSE